MWYGTQSEDSRLEQVKASSCLEASGRKLAGYSVQPVHRGVQNWRLVARGECSAILACLRAANRVSQ